MPDIVSKKLSEELSAKRIAGPFPSPPLPNFKVSPLALREKKNSKKYRLIHNLSHPYDLSSVNSNIPTDYSTIKYASLSSAIKLIQNSPNCYLGKTDIADAFRLIPLNPNQYHLTGFSFNNDYYFDKVLPQGCSSSCYIFEKFSDSLSWILTEHYDVDTLVKVLDDFLFVGSSYSETLRQLNNFRVMCKKVGVPIAEHKTEGPVKCLTFLGIELDTENMEARLPKDKLSRYTADILDLLQKDKCTLRQMQSIIGKLQFSTSVVTCGKCFLRRMYDCIIGIKKPYYFIKLTDEIKQDLQIWLTFLKNYNGVTIISDKSLIDSSEHHLYTDSSTIGYGASFLKDYIYGSFPSSWKNFSIEVLELYPIFLILNVLAHNLSHTKVCIHCDNSAIVHILNKQSSKSKLVMKLLRPIVLLLLKYDISLYAKHVPGKDNKLCDALSRLQFNQDLLLSFGMNLNPLEVPSHLRPVNLRMT